MNRLKGTIKKTLINTKNELEYQYFSLFPSKLNITSPIFIQKPHKIFHKLRDVSSVHYLPQQKAWLVVAYDDVVKVLTQHQNFSNSILATLDNGVLVGNDPPDHNEMRNFLKEFFSPQKVLDFKEIIESHTNSFIKHIQQMKTFDLCQDFTQPLVNMIMSDFLGFDPNRIEEAQYHLNQNCSLDTLQPLLKKDSLLQGIYNEPKLSEKQKLGLIKLFLVAGLRTTNRAIPNCLYTIIQYDSLKKKIIHHSDLIPSLIEELLRLEPVSLALPRLTLKEIELSGVTIPAGELVYASMAGANRDPKKFDKPNEIILNRGLAKHLSFGMGVHRCLGRHIAMLELQIIIKALVTNFPNLRSIKPLNKIQFVGEIAERGISEFILTIN